MRAFESEQRSVVFSALLEYLHQGLFTDVTLMCEGGTRSVRAHKAVLAASSKMFRDIFKHDITICFVDMDKELAPNGISLTEQDLQLIIGILYCDNTTNLTTSRLHWLLLVAQVLGIPTIINYCKRYRDLVSDSSSLQKSLIDDMQSSEKSFDCDGHRRDSFDSTLMYALPTEDEIGGVCKPSDRSRLQELGAVSSEGDSGGLSPPCRSNSAFSLSFNHLPSPSPSFSSANPASVSAGVTESSVNLESLVPLLNSLQANQLDALEQVLLPHLNAEDSNSSGLLTTKRADNSDIDGPPIPSTSTASERPSTPFGSQIVTDGISALLSLSYSNQSLPGRCRDLASESSSGDLFMPSSRSFSITLPNLSEVPNEQGWNETLLCSSEESVKEPPVSIKEHSKPKAVNKPSADDAKESEEQPSSEIRISLENVTEGKSFKFPIPGSSKSVTFNFSADALEEMKNSVTKSDALELDQLVVSSSTLDDDDLALTYTKAESTIRNSFVSTKMANLSRSKATIEARKKKKKLSIAEKATASSGETFRCRFCTKTFSSKPLLDRHARFHVEVNGTCKICGKLFYKKWLLEQHMAVDHGKGRSLHCVECGREFRWERNLLAHFQLEHPEEVRKRCRYCPLTFVHRGRYINHHRKKHSQLSEPWCKFCLTIFDSAKHSDDHECTRIENTGKSLICHQHDPPIEFKSQMLLDKHLKLHSSDTNLSQLQMSCPVCLKTFLLKKNLVTHMRRFHDAEARSSRFKCSLCHKAFFYASDRDEHENAHRGDKKFPCHCGRAYSSKKALLQHRKIVHDNSTKTFTCDICNKSLSNQYKLKYHMMVHSDKRCLKCSFCDTVFKARENLLKHVAKKHPSSAEQAAVEVEPSTTSLDTRILDATPPKEASFTV